MKLNNKFVAIVPVYNMEPYIIDSICSIIDQDYTDIGIIIRDDMSTDSTPKLISDYIGIDGIDQQKVKFKNRDIIFIRNDKKMYPAGNIYESAMEYIDDDSVMGIVDGDDHLCKSYAVSRVMSEYDADDIWLVWSQHRLASGGTNPNSNVAGLSKPLPDDSAIQNRQYWAVSHFRTNKKFLFNHLNREDMLDYKNADQYSPVCGDAAYLYPLVEMCGRDRTLFVDEVLYHYRDNLSTNEHRGKYNKAVEYGLRLKTLKPYKKL